MALDPSIIMSGQTPNFLAIQDAANNAAQNQIQNQNQNALTQYIRQNGAGIMAGDRNALAGYAAFDPQNALAIQGQQEQMSMRREEFAMRKAEVARQTAAELEAKKGQLDAAALEKERAQLERALTGAGAFYQRGDKAGYNNFLSQMGLDPAQFPFENFEATAAQYEGVLEGISAWQKVFGAKEANPNDRFKVVGSQLVDLSAEGGPSVVMTSPGQTETVYGPDGKPILTRGPAGVEGKLTEAQSKDVGFATRARGALQILEPVADSLASAGGRFLESASAYDPTGLVRGAQSNEFQTAYQAGGEFLVALLRKDTGAAVTPQEEAYYGRIYLPQPGDGPDVLQQKKLARERAVAALEAGMPANAIAAQEEALLRSNAAVPQPTQQGGPTRKRYNPATGAFE